MILGVIIEDVLGVVSQKRNQLNYSIYIYFSVTLNPEIYIWSSSISFFVVILNLSSILIVKYHIELRRA